MDQTEEMPYPKVCEMRPQNSVRGDGVEMMCAVCGSDSRVISCAKEDNKMYRKRVCIGCGRRWSTEEYENNSPRVAGAVDRIRNQKYGKRGKQK